MKQSYAQCVLYSACACIHTGLRSVGKGASKKWKASLRVDKGDGVPGPTMGDWLVDAGLDSAKAVRPKAPPSMQAARRQQPARQQYGGHTPKPTGKQVSSP